VSAVTLYLRQLGNELVQPFNLRVAPGEICCISGASGSGKSRLLRAVADLEPHDGQVLLNDLEQQQLPADRWRQRVRLVPAESQWWEECVGEHFSTACADEDLAALGLPDDAPDWQVSRLSTGERQRLGILRALSVPLDVLLLDEPCANLDPDTTRRVEALLLERIRVQGWPVLWVAHDAEQIRRVADAHLSIDEGCLVEVK